MKKIKYVILASILLIAYASITLYLHNLLIPNIGLIRLLIIIGALFLGYYLFKDIMSEDEHFFEQQLKVGIFKRWKLKLFSLLTLIAMIYIVVDIKKHLPGIYNKSVVYYKQYEKKTSERAGYYDKLWKTFTQKQNIAWLNKETFIEVTKIIFEGRKDGQNVTWKWLTENQQVPYGEFTKFYTDLSTFIETEREGYFTLEKQCQEIAMNHNLLIDTFPNNMYNLLLNRKPIKYSYGFLSDSTNRVFSTGKENIQLIEK